MSGGGAEAKGEPTLVERLADWSLAINAADIPPHALTRAKLLLLDTIGCAFSGFEEHAAQAVVRLARGNGGAPQCTVIGAGFRSSLAEATFANGVLMRALDLNDYTVGARGAIGGHPSDNIPAALAAAEHCGASGRELLAAIVIGYEIYGRLREAMDKKAEWDGVSVSAAAATAMAGRLMGLSRAEMAQALALSLARGSTPAVVRSGDISAAKSIANALVAQSGVQAALLAREGVTGPRAIFEHRRGIGALYPDAGALARLDDRLGEEPYISGALIKAFPCLATGQGIVAAGLALHRALGGRIADAARVRVVMADTPTVRDQKDDPGRIDPKSREAADHSFQFLAAVSILDGEFGLRQFDNARWNDPEVRALMARLDLSVDAGLAARAPGVYPCAMETRDATGKAVSVEVLRPPGVCDDGIDAGAVLEKFNSLAREAADAKTRERIVSAAMALDAGGDTRELFAAIGAAIDPRWRG